MKYYLSGRLQSHNYINSWFSRSVKNTNQSLPQSMTFLIKTGDRVIGRVGIGPLRNRKGADAEIGYAIEQSYSGKGITKKAVKTLLSFLEQLRYYNRCYNFKRIRAVTKPENKASNSILASCGFILSKNPVNSKFGVKNEYFYYF